jgi:hypothetical protein
MLPHKVYPPLDALGKEIQVGDKVVYAVKTREGGLQVGEVLDIIPYDKEGSGLNPSFNENIPQTFGQDTTNSRWLREPQTHYKLKVKTSNSVYNSISRQYEDHPTTKTLDTPRRFAIVQ